MGNFGLKKVLQVSYKYLLFYSYIVLLGFQIHDNLWLFEGKKNKHSKTVKHVTDPESLSAMVLILVGISEIVAAYA